jgi:hypothetical protein
VNHSIITPEARERCEHEAKRLADLRALRELQITIALKTINDHYDALEQGKEPAQLGRCIFDRRASDTTERLARYGISS